MAKDIKTKLISFPGSQGTTLQGRLDLPPDESPHAFALYAHCFTCSKNLKSIHALSGALARHGIGVCRFDFTGLGDSQGDFADTNLSTNVADLKAAADYLEAHYRPPDILIGHSLGGSAVLQLAHQGYANAVVTIAAPFSPQHLQHLMKKNIKQSHQDYVVVSVGPRDYRINRHFFQDLDDNAMRQNIHELKAPLLVLHAAGDGVIEVKQGEQLFEEAPQPKSFVVLPHADHLISSESMAVKTGELVSAWYTLNKME
ncbi:MAG: alpha/beta fold hydrolase [candidate division KSB1 bacterium]|nr:alpha/beta fold hydrolase [candidate division KSB1 bacterium]